MPQVGRQVIVLGLRPGVSQDPEWCLLLFQAKPLEPPVVLSVARSGIRAA